MVMIYVQLIHKKLKTIEQVPEAIRAEVQEILNKYKDIDNERK